MTVKRRVISGLCLLAGLAVAGYTRLFWVRTHFPSPGSVARLNRELPSLPVVDASGRIVDISKATLGGKSIVVFYSASCHACELVLPELQPFPPTLRLLLVNEGAGLSSSSRYKTGFEKALHFCDRNGVRSRSFPMSGLPTILFVDERGVLRDGLVGKHSREIVQRKLKAFAEISP